MTYRSSWVLPILLGVGGCSAPQELGSLPGDTDETDATAASGPSTSGGSGATASMATDSSDAGGSATDPMSDWMTTSEGDAGSDLGGCYDASVHPYSGSLCGPASHPCVVAVDETVDPQLVFRNGAPSITHDSNCSPQILFTTAESQYRGHIATRAAGWESWEMPVATACGVLVYDAMAGNPQVLLYDGAQSVAVGVWDGDGVAALPKPPGIAVSCQAAGLGYGVLHMTGGIPQADPPPPVLARYDGSWTSQELDPRGAGTMAVSETGHPQLAGWSLSSGDWRLYWQEPKGQSVEEVAEYGSNGLAIGQVFLTVVGSSVGTPHVLFGRITGQGQELTVATRDTANAWTLRTIASNSVSPACSSFPSDGELCHVDRFEYRPLGILSSHNGDLRALYAEDHIIATLVASCNGGPGCQWTTIDDSSVYSLEIASGIGSGDLESATLLDDRKVFSLGTSLDGNGDIHIAAYVEDAPQVFSVDYLQLSAQ